MCAHAIVLLLASATFYQEPFMMSMVPWIDEHLPQCKDMFLDLSTVIPSGIVESAVRPDQDMNEVIAGLNNHLNTHKENFLKSLSEHFNDQRTMVLTIDPGLCSKTVAEWVLLRCVRRAAHLR
jgi:hypothetical protein